jgi:hypothetical protein
VACGPAPPVAALADSAETASWDSGALRAADPLLPAPLGTIQTRFEGKPGRPFVFVIGESHVRLEVQQAVADTLAYLHRAFDVRVIGSEGFSGPLPLPRRIGPEAVRYAAAWTGFFDQREINAVEYVALTVPGVEVHGISDVAAYEDHGKALDSLQDQRKDWAARFARFLEEEVATLQVTADEGTRLVEAWEEATESGEFAGFAEVLCDIKGRSSAVCRRFEAFLSEDEDLEASGDALTSIDHPLMQRRDRALVTNTLALAGNGRAALVVGYLHVPGVERALQAAGVSYLVIVPPGVEEEVTHSTPMSPEDLMIWEGWKQAIPTDFKTWFDARHPSPPQHKPPPLMLKEWMRNHFEVVQAFVLADHLLLTSTEEAEVRRLLDQSDLPPAFQVVHCYSEGDVRWVEFRVGAKTGYAAFGPRSSFVSPVTGAMELEAGALPDGRHYAVYDGGSGGPPLKPPRFTTTPPADDGPFRRVHVAFERQQRENPGALTIAYGISGNQVHRFVNGTVQLLPASPTLLADLRRRLDEEPPGPERLEAAQRLAELLLMGIEEDLPAGPITALYQVSGENVLGRYALPFLATLAAHPSAERLRSIGEVYAVSPAARDLEAILSEPAPPVDVGRTVVWLSDRLADHPGYPEVVAAIEEAGARVNVLPADGDTLVLLGDPRGGWAVGLEEGQERRAGTADFRADVARASAVVAIGAGLSAEDLAEARGVHTIEASADHVLELGRKTVEAISRASGRETLDQAVREIASEETVELRDLLGRSDSLSRVAESVASTAEHATVRSRT